MERPDLAEPSAFRSPLRRSANGVAADAATSVHNGTEVSELRQLLERQKRTFDLAMTASQMGTWRYTLADNICDYDENAQRLYGLTEARFLHDEAGVKSKFHPDDLDAMWSRVSKALDPQGDGRYDVEYRVKQLDGSGDGSARGVSSSSKATAPRESRWRSPGRAETSPSGNRPRNCSACSLTN